MLTKYKVFGIKTTQYNKEIVFYKEYRAGHTLKELKKYNAAAIAAAKPEYITAAADLETMENSAPQCIFIEFKKIIPCMYSGGFIFY